MIYGTNSIIIEKIVAGTKGQDYKSLIASTVNDLDGISSSNKMKAFISLNKFKDAGLFQPAENDLNFFKYDAIYHIEFNFKKAESGSFIFQYDYEKDKLQIYGRSPYGNDFNFGSLTLDEFITKTKSRFTHYDFTPENGWGFMHYLAFLSSPKYAWNETMIKSIDGLVSKGYMLNSILPLIEIGVASEDLESSLGMPLSWVQKAHNYNPPNIMVMVDEAWVITKNQKPAAPRKYGFSLTASQNHQAKGGN